jgi:hypothetical protein
MRTFALSMKRDEICGLTGQQKFPSAQASVSGAKPKTELNSEIVKITNKTKNH